MSEASPRRRNAISKGEQQCAALGTQRGFLSRGTRNDLRSLPLPSLSSSSSSLHRDRKPSVERLLLIAVIGLFGLDVLIQAKIGQVTATQAVGDQRGAGAETSAGDPAGSRNLRETRQQGNAADTAPLLNPLQTDTVEVSSPLEASIIAANSARGEHHPPLEKCNYAFIIANLQKNGKLERNRCNRKLAKVLKGRGASNGVNDKCSFSCEELLLPQQKEAMRRSTSIVKNGWEAPSYLTDYPAEVLYQRDPEEGLGFGHVDDTFLGVVVVESSEACTDEFMYHRLANEGSKAEKAAWAPVLANSKILCSSLTSLESARREVVVGKDAEKSKWGIEIFEEEEASSAGSYSLDARVRASGVSDDIKDVVLVSSSAKNPVSGQSIVMNGLITLARTRYVEFPYDACSDVADDAVKLSEVVDKIGQLGFNCYWRGQLDADNSREGRVYKAEGLWRLTDCFQDFYDGHGGGGGAVVACANRNLAPNLAARMEEAFENTVGKWDPIPKKEK